MSPTIVLDHDGRPLLAVGSPGGATIITTVTQVLLGHLDRDLPLVDAIAAPRLSSRNGASSQAEPAIVNGPLGAGLIALGHNLASTPEIGAATAIRLLPGDGSRPPPRPLAGVAAPRWWSALPALTRRRVCRPVGSEPPGRPNAPSCSTTSRAPCSAAGQAGLGVGQGHAVQPLRP